MDVASLFAVALLGQLPAADPFGNAPPKPAATSPVAERYGPTNVAPPNFLPSAGGSAAITSPIIPAAASSPPAASFSPSATSPSAASALPPQAYSATPAAAVAAPSSIPTATIAAPAFTPTNNEPSHNQPPPASESARPSIATEADRAANLIRESLVLPKSLAVAGRPTTLLEAMHNADERRRQLAIVAAYWKLAAATADYHFAWQQTQLLKAIADTAAGMEQGADAARAKAEIASRSTEAQARAHEAQLRFITSQHALSAAAALDPTQPSPLTIDLPHTGVYHTSFEKVYARRAPPAQAYLLNRTLPLRFEAVGIRAEATVAAHDSFAAAFEAYRGRQLGIDELLRAADALQRHRGEFIAAVERYNNEIAEYAFGGAPEGTSRETLVGMLIKTEFTPRLGRAIAPADIAPVSFTAPVTPDAISSAAASIDDSPAVADFGQPPGTATETFTAGAEVPTITPPPAYFSGTEAGALVPAAPPTIPTNVLPATPAAPRRNEPTLAPPQQPSDSPLRFKVNRLPLDDASIGASDASREVALPEAGGASPYSSSSAAQVGTSESSVKSNSFSSIIPPSAVVSPTQLLEQPLVEESAAPVRDEHVEPAGYYSGLQTMSAERRVQELVEWLHGAHDEAGTTDVKLALGECVASTATAERTTVIDDYWAAAEAATHRIATWQKAEQLDALAQAALRQSAAEQAALAMLTIHAEQLAAKADELDANADLLAAQWRLTNDLRRPLVDRWVMPSTLPHAGGYETKLDMLPPTLAESRRVREVAERVSVQYEILRQRAESVLAADAAAEGALQKFAAGQAPASLALDAFDRQASETDALLSTTTRYNLEIADYALAVLPAATPDTVLVGALVLNRNAIR